ncbi:uncharacterized protein LOC130693407 [Daphnia carinata]|uniref:uncharacterized protein LOC130693407 n=1 Tax=Daphnia carinata TaxID=120202 RepID=UPI00257E5822|nr:uncharacterized protein LOC130693407 [Daphnia carinata]
MHLTHYLTFVGAAVLVVQFKKSQAFNLGRNVSFIANLDDRNSHDGLTDNVERAQEPASQNSDITRDGDSFSEVGDRLTEQDNAKKIIDGPFFRQTVEQKGFSNVILSSQIDSFLATTQKPAVVQSPAVDSRKSIDRPFGGLDDISSELGDRVAFPVNQVADGRASNKDTQLNVVRLRHSNERDDEDDSLEVQLRPVKDGNQLSLERERSPVSLDATDFHNLRDNEFLIHPESEDWFLVKQYMDDDYFRNAAEELAGEYFWQPVKNSKRFDSESAEESNESN